MYDQKPAVSEDPFGVSFENLPRDLPVFPLPGAMLLPHGRMPLNIFEPRYLKMIMDSLKQSRLIGMVQPLELLPDPVPEQTKLLYASVTYEVLFCTLTWSILISVDSSK